MPSAPTSRRTRASLATSALALSGLTWFAPAARAQAPSPTSSPAPTTSAAPEGAPAPTSSAPGAAQGSSAQGSSAQRTRERLARDPEADGLRPSPLEVDYAQYGVGIAAEVLLEPGAICPASDLVPCIVGSGGGPVLRGGYRPSGAYYVGGAYQFSKLDSSNLYRLGILQELRGEMRYFLDTRARVSPYVTWGLGGAIYGNEFGAETGGVVATFGGGLEFEVSRSAVIAANVVYKPILLVGFTDAAGLERSTGIAQFLHLELLLELRSELHRE